MGLMCRLGLVRLEEGDVEAMRKKRGLDDCLLERIVHRLLRYINYFHCVVISS